MMSPVTPVGEFGVMLLVNMVCDGLCDVIVSVSLMDREMVCTMFWLLRKVVLTLLLAWKITLTYYITQIKKIPTRLIIVL